LNSGVHAGLLSWSPPRTGEAEVFRPHDLLWVTDWRALHAAGPLPPWAGAGWMARAPVVVRRERIDGAARIPVGLRGKARNERLAAYLESGAVLRRVSPEMLAREAAWRRMPYLECLPAVVALERIAPALDASGLRWGPTGSMGYVLTSGLPVLRPESDLDLLVRAATPLTRDQAQQLQFMLDGHGCRIDMQIDTGHGGFAFAEWARRTKSDGRVLLKTDLGPFLTGDPWNQTGWLDTVDREAA
jgi:phosphoribosyl-dephospho-CoA transferase